MNLHRFISQTNLLLPGNSTLWRFDGNFRLLFRCYNCGVWVIWKLSLCYMNVIRENSCYTNFSPALYECYIAFIPAISHYEIGLVLVKFLPSLIRTPDHNNLLRLDFLEQSAVVFLQARWHPF